MTPRNLIDGHEPDVVPVIRVLRAGVTEANKEAHDAASRGPAYFFLSPPPAGAFAPAAGSCAARRRTAPPQQPPQPPQQQRRRRGAAAAPAARGSSRSSLLLFGVAGRRHDGHQRCVFARQRLHAGRQLDVGQMQRVADFQAADIGLDVLRDVVDRRIRGRWCG